MKMEPIIKSFKELWGKLSMPMRIGGGVLVLGVFLSLMFIALFSSTDYQPLYTNLTPEDAASIVTVLRDNGIPYELSDNGSTIHVPAEHVYETRLTLASQGLPKGGVVGFEIFNTTRLGETESDRELRYLVALQGELTRTIKELSEVQDARVHIVLPRRSLFIQESQPSTASVLLTLKPGVTLSKKQVLGITHLLSTSVEGLLPENITIIDNRGNVLSDSLSLLETIDSDLIVQRIQIESAYERQLSNTLTAMLERVYGVGKVVALVNVELDFDINEQYSEIYQAPTPDGGLIRSEQTYREEFTGSTYSAIGIPGVESNVPGYVGLDDSDRVDEYSKVDSVLNYELNRIERRYNSTPGSIKRLGVAVWINGELTEEQLESIESSIIGAIGLQLERGDQISVNSIPFRDDFMSLATQDLSSVPSQNLTLLYIILVILVLAVIVLSVIFYQRKKKLQEELLAAGQEVQADDEDELFEQPLTAEEKLRLNISKRLREQALDKPEEFAQMLRTWLLND